MQGTRCPHQGCCGCHCNVLHKREAHHCEREQCNVLGQSDGVGFLSKWTGDCWMLLPLILDSESVWRNYFICTLRRSLQKTYRIQWWSSAWHTSRSRSQD